jgi:hypothetical protein
VPSVTKRAKNLLRKVTQKMNLRALLELIKDSNKGLSILIEDLKREKIPTARI